MEGDKLKRMGGALCHADRLESLVNPIHAVIAFNRLITHRVNLGNMPRTGASAGHTADAFFFIDIDNAIVSFYHSLCWTDRNTERLIAVITGLEGEFGLGNPLNLF